MSQFDEQPQPGPSASKKVRMTMACERCRTKKVKCDFSHPSCSRCQQAKAQCSYDGSATQVDLFNLMKLNETVDMLQKRVQSIESDMKDVSTNTQYVADEFRHGHSSPLDRLFCNKPSESPTISTSHNSLPKWSLSLTPNGLRVDTNIISIHDLYDILASAASVSPPRMDMEDVKNTSHPLLRTTIRRHESGSSPQETMPVPAESVSSDSTSFIDRSATITRRKDVWKTKLKTFPLYSTWEPSSTCRHAIHCHPHYRHTTVTNVSSSSIKAATSRATTSQQVLDSMMEIYTECLLCFPCADPENSVAQRYKQGTLDPLLENVVFAWTARHGAIYHDLFPGQDPNEASMPFFKRAKELLKERFTTTSVDTMHSLLIMYVYAIGQSSEQRGQSSESEAYMYLGLAIRMCLDMKMNIRNKDDDEQDVVAGERKRRFFWAVYFLETLCTIHSDKVFSLPPEDTITVGFPSVLPHEDGEKRWRVLFTGERFKITRIYRNMLNKTAHKKPLLSSISTLEKELQGWYEQLPSELRYTRGDIYRRNWASKSFREQACVKLNSEYHFQLCQLYRLFAAATDDDDVAAEESDSEVSGLSGSGSSSTTNKFAIEYVAEERCVQSADTLVELLECYARLDQRWCHFSLETVMMATLVYSRLLGDRGSEGGKVAWAHKQLNRIAQVLATCPIRHHRYVAALVQRIKKLSVRRPNTSTALGINGEDDLDLNNVDEEDEEEDIAPINMEDDPALALPCDPSHSNARLVTTVVGNSQHHQLQQQAVGREEGQIVQGSYFELKDAAGVDILQLSEFLYTPSLLGMCNEQMPATGIDPLLSSSATATAAAAYDTSVCNTYFTPQFLPALPRLPPLHGAQQQPAVTLFDTSQSHPPPISSATAPPSTFNMASIHHYPSHQKASEDDSSSSRFYP